MANLAEEVVKALHDQLHREYQASGLYRQAYFWFDLKLYPGTAKFFKVTSPAIFSNILNI